MECLNGGVREKKSSKAILVFLVWAVKQNTELFKDKGEDRSKSRFGGWEKAGLEDKCSFIQVDQKYLMDLWVEMSSRWLAIHDKLGEGWDGVNLGIVDMDELA